jgi:GDPmannose 4,6-dehydratase
MFGDNSETPQNENTRFSPVSPYACAKLAAHHLVDVYRKSYNIYACSGILFNHESPRRGEDFVTRKITRAAARIKLGLQTELVLGNLDSYRDWGFAGDYVIAMWLMLQQQTPEDYVVATGHTYTVREFLDYVFEYAGLDIEKHVKIDKKLLRPCEVPRLCGDFSKAKEKLGWSPRTDLKSLAKIMFEEDLRIAQKIKLSEF